MTSDHRIDAIYRERCDRFSTERDRVSAHDRWLGHARFPWFLGLGGALDGFPATESQRRRGDR